MTGRTTIKVPGARLLEKKESFPALTRCRKRRKAQNGRNRKAREFDKDAEKLVADVWTKWQELVTEHPRLRHCGICRATDFHIELGRTVFQTMEEARGPLAESELLQRITAEYFRQSRN